MTVRPASDIYAALIGAGYAPPAAVIQTAVDLAESGGDDTAVGDINLETAQWGPSVGVSQIRTLRAQTGTGSDRDIARLMGNLTAQSQASYDISNRGTDFTPWSTFDSGAYQRYLGQAQAAAAAVGTAGTAATTTGLSIPLPWELPQWVGGQLGQLSQAQAATVGGARSILLESVGVVAGLALVLVGWIRLAKPIRQPLADAGHKGKQVVGTAIAVAV